MDYAKHLLAHHFPLFAQTLRLRDDIWHMYHDWALMADAPQIKKFQVYFSIAYPEQFKALFDGRTFSAKDVQKIETEYFRELRKANNENERAFKDALKILL